MIFKKTYYKDVYQFLGRRPPPQTATEVLRIPFSSIIGGPLKACVEAQAEQAETTAKFIKEVGLDPDKEAEEKE